MGQIPSQAGPIKRVLVLYEVGPNHPAIAEIDQGISDNLQQAPYQVQIYREYLDSDLFPDPASQQEFRDWYAHKYRDRKPDLIIAAGPSALGFMVAAHKTFFSDVPVVFCVSTRAAAGAAKLDPLFTGIWEEPAPAKTLEVALSLQPRTQHVFLVGGTSPYDRFQEALFREQLHDYESKLDLEYLTELPMPQLLERLRHLPDHSVVLHIGILRDAAGRVLIDATEAGPMVLQAANAPVFSFTDVNLGHGEVGGDVFSFADEGKAVGDSALRVLGGERPQDIPIAREANVYMFDWRALKHWGIQEGSLPPGSIILNRQPSFWELYKLYVFIGIFALFAETAAILGLLWQRAEKRKTEAELRRSEAKFSKAFQRSPLAFTLSSLVDYRFVEVNDSFERTTGWMRDEVIGRTALQVGLWVDSSQRSIFLDTIQAGGSVRNLEILCRKKDGQVWVGLVSSELIDVHGEPCALSLIADITDRKRAEEVLSSVSRRLLQAQEQERTRIGRELHDDINQRLALLENDVTALQQKTPDSAAELQEKLELLRKGLSQIGTDIQGMSHRLHSSKLEYLGLVAACRGFCNELTERQKVTVDFQTDGVPRDLPHDVSLTLFRVLQESLSNAIKHSGSSHFEVRLRGASGEVHLVVRDNGVGFDGDSAMNTQGLGLISMRERVALVNGTISIASQPQRGTDVHVCIPVGPADGAQKGRLRTA